MNNTLLTGIITRENKEGGWKFVNWPESVACLGTGKATKVSVKIEGHEFNITCLPTGDGTHFLPINKAIMKATGKVVGDMITLEICRPK
jgi:Domain of unknown function (DUF1905)